MGRTKWYKELDGKADLKDKKCGQQDVEAAAKKGFDQGKAICLFSGGDNVQFRG